jgi:arylsulfatase A-like enzyme
MRSLKLAGLLVLAACKGNEAPPPAQPPATTAPPPATSAPQPTASASAAPPAEPAGPPKDMNVIVLSIDSMRADMPWAGYSRDIAPRLTALEKTAVSYTKAYAVSSYTSMSLGGFLAGKIPSGLTRSGYFFGQYPADNTFFPELLKDGKVLTMGVHAHFYFKDAGFEQGFAKWEIVPGIKADNTTDNNITSPQSEQLAEKLLGDPALESQRFFFWAHFLDPHDVYMAHPGVGPYGKSERDKYDAEITFTDQHVGKLLDFIASKPWAKKTAIIITSDHGEAFGEHGQTRHGFEIWENLVRVPMFFVMPGATAKRIDTPRSALDLAPTIMELLGVAPSPAFEGKSLVKELYGEKAEPRDVIVDLPMTSDNDKRRALVRGNLKLTCYGGDLATCKLFDVEKDPGEEKPITSGDDFKTLMEAFKAHAKTVKEVAPTRCGAGCLNKAYLNKK